jgi:hypothetical protein
MNNLVENVPAVTEPTLPATYEAARTAIAQCAKIDECKDWADKAAAMKAYAIMSHDRTLHNFALRIQLRAERRCGELSKAIPSRNKRGRADELLGARKFEVLEAAGVSRNQAYQAETIAGIPQADFDAQVDSDRPPTVTQLVKGGATKRPQSEDAEAREIAKATDVIRAFALFCEKTDPGRIVDALSGRARADLQRHFSTIDQWLNRFEDSDDAVLRPADTWSADLDSSALSAGAGASENAAIDSTSNRADYERASRGC